MRCTFKGNDQSPSVVCQNRTLITSGSAKQLGLGHLHNCYSGGITEQYIGPV